MVVGERSASRTAAGAVMINDLIRLMVWVRALTALARTTRSPRIASTEPSRCFGVPLVRPESAAVAVA